MQADDLHSVGPAKVAKGVVGRNQHAAGLRQQLDLLDDPLIQCVEALLVAGTVLAIDRRPVRVYCAQTSHDRLDRLRPQRYVEPYVGIEVALEFWGAQQALFWYLLGHGQHLLAAGHFGEDVFHLAFEKKAVEENQIRGRQLGQIALRCLVVMRIDARAHHPDNRDAVAADIPGEVGHHPSGTHYLNPPVFALGSVATQRAQQNENPEHGPLLI